MNPLDRRDFLKNALWTTAALSLPGATSAAAAAANTVPAPMPAAGLIDTNVNLFDWPFRTLTYRDTRALVAKLRKHQVIEAWAGSFEALLHKDMAGVNARLAAECRTHGSGFLVPFGSVSLAWPDWEEDVRRCHEEHRMPGIRIYPGYQAFTLDHPDMARLLKMCEERNLILQVVFAMEDSRIYHPIVNVGPVVSASLLAALKGAPNAKVELVHFTGSPRGEDLHQFVTQTNAVIDISRFEGNGAIGRLLGTGPEFSSAGAPGISYGHAPADRLVFGSHAPYYPLETALFKLMESPLSASELHAIMQGNARRLLPRA